MPPPEPTTAPLRVIFLDFDGVLNSSGYLTRERHGDVGDAAQIDPDAIALLNQLIEATDAVVVVSSTWRHGRMLTELRELLTSRGFRGKLIGKTPELTERTPGALYRARPRGHEIQAWLDQRKSIRGDVGSFVILDDDADMDHLMSRLVRTTFIKGLTIADVVRATDLLQTPV